MVRSRQWSAALAAALVAAVLAGAGRPPRREAAEGAGGAATNVSFDTNLFFYEEPVRSREEARGAWNVIGSLLRSLVVLAVLGGGAWVFLRWLSRRTVVPGEGTSVFRVVARHAVSPGRTLCLVRIFDSYCVLAFSEAGVAVVREVRDRLEVEKAREVEAALPAGAERAPDFGEALASALRRAGEAGKLGSSSDRILAFLRRQKERLRRMGGDDGS